MEQEVRKERQAAGIAAAKERGVYSGRKQGTTKAKPERAKALRAKRCQSCQTFYVYQPSIRDLRVAEVERFETGQGFQVLQPGIRDLRAVEVK